MNSIEDRVIDIVAVQFQLKRNEVNLNTKFTDDLGADSLDTVNLHMMIEEEFKLDIPEEQVERWDSVNDIVDYVKEQEKKVK